MSHSKSYNSSGHIAVPLELRNLSEVHLLLIPQLMTTRKQPLLSPTNLRRGPTENMSCGLCPLLCDVIAYAHMCLPSRCLEMGCVTPLFYCVRLMQGVYQAVALQCVEMSHCFLLKAVHSE
jgi:hypothetical protein